jgi:ParB family transcriptional regulator, chromosome partitioning protein
MRHHVHPMEEPAVRPLLNLDELKCSIEQISVRTGKNPAYVAARVKLTELAPVVIQAGA